MTAMIPVFMKNCWRPLVKKQGKKHHAWKDRREECCQADKGKH